MGPLNQKLREIREAGEARRDAETNAIMHRATEELRESGILEGVVTAGEQAPRFARPSLEGDTVRLSGVLREGPAVLSFFRGRW
ncbi:MAG: hypothetical protein R3266_04455 [Gemmatimonadota bacterium]|nr:hypothetical protein [Gemmatimonadota bacterium]